MRSRAVVVRRRGLPEATDEEREAYYARPSLEASARIVTFCALLALAALIAGFTAWLWGAL